MQCRQTRGEIDAGLLKLRVSPDQPFARGVERQERLYLKSAGNRMGRIKIALHQGPERVGDDWFAGKIRRFAEERAGPAPSHLRRARPRRPSRPSGCCGLSHRENSAPLPGRYQRIGCRSTRIRRRFAAVRSGLRRSKSIVWRLAKLPRRDSCGCSRALE